MASVTKRGSVWSVRYRVTDDAGNISMKRVSGFATKEQAWEQARRLERLSNAGIDVHGDSMTCGQLMERWFAEHCVNHVAATTLSKYSDGIDRISKHPVYTLQIKRVNAQTQKRLIDDLRNGTLTGQAHFNAYRHEPDGAVAPVHVMGCQTWLYSGQPAFICPASEDAKAQATYPKPARH